MNFGAEFDMLQIDGEDSGELTENNLQHAFQAIDGYTANMKQKDLKSPLESVIQLAEMSYDED